MAGMIQLYGTQRTASPYEWKKTYQLYIPKELLISGSNVLRLEVNQQAWHGTGIKPYMVWVWDYLSLEALGQPATEPIHGKMSYLGTQITNCENCFDTNETTMLFAPNMLKWLGIAYSNNTMRANLYKNPWWNNIGDQSKATEYLELLKSYNMTVIGQRYATLTVNQINNEPNIPIETNPDGTLGDIPKQILSEYFTQYGSYFQYHEVDNEPGLFNRTFRGNLALATYINQIKPAHIKTTAPGWAYWASNGDPWGWERDPAYRRQIEDLCQATNGHSYGRSYTDDEGGSFVETLETYGGVNDGWPKEYVNTETGTEGGHTDFDEAGASQTHASIFDRIMRGHVSVVDRTLQHAAFFGWYGLFEYPTTAGNANGLQAYPGVDGEDTRVKTFRRLALAYATHGAPLKYEHLNKTTIAGKKVYFRGVNTATLAPVPGSGATANKILLNFVNFEGTTQTMQVRVTLPGCGTITGERIGAGNVYSAATSSVTLTSTPTVDLTVELGPRESVQYILNMPTGTCTSSLRDPENPTNTAAGLDYKYYEGTWNALPDFNALTAVKSGTTTGFDLSIRNRNDNFGFSYTGFVNVPTDGTYTFYTSSDDGSKVYIGTTQVVDNDGLHGIQERSGSIGLKAGKHAITVTFFEQGGGEALSVSYSSTAIAKTLVPASSLFRTTTSSGIDLSVTDISWTPSSPVNGNAVTFSATIQNNGTAATPAGVIHGVGFWVDGNKITWSDNSTASLAAGASRTVTATGPTYTFTTGSHSVEAFVDDVNRMAESNETNNIRTETIGGGFSGDYSVLSKHSGKAMEVASASTINGGNVQQNTYSGATNQIWTIQAVGAYYKLTAKHSGKVLDVSGGVSATGDEANIHQWENFGADNQLWSIEAVADGFYRLIAKHSGKCADVTGASTADGANIHQWTYGGWDNQLWNFTTVNSSAARQAAVEQEKLSESSFHLFPMPVTNNELNINYYSESNQQINLEFTSLQGSKIKGVSKSVSKGSNSFSVDVQDMKNGVYLLTLQSINKREVKKIIITR